MLAAVKTSLRITSDLFDDDLTELIETCKADMTVKGVEVIDESNMLTRQAIKLYCRASFANGDVKERELYNDRYIKLVEAMALCSLYESSDLDVL